MNRPFEAGRTIDVEVSRSGVWTHSPAAPLAAERLPGGSRLGSIVRFLLLLCGVFVGAGAAVLFAFSDAGWAQPPSSWRAATPKNPTVLRDAVSAGVEAGLALYPCRAPLEGGVQIGRYRSDFGGCHIGYAGKELEIAPFEILGAVWTDGAKAVGPGSLVAGSQFALDSSAAPTPEPVLTCRASFKGGTHSGSIGLNDKSCNFGFGGRAIASENYAVLQAAPWMTWVPATPSTLPVGAIAGGDENGEPFFVCRAPAPHGLFSGKVNKALLGCSIPYDGKELVEKRFEVLVPRWEASSGGAVAVAGIAVGRQADNPLFLCRTQSRGTLQLGEVNETLAGCHVGMQESDVSLQDYEILVQ